MSDINPTGNFTKLPTATTVLFGAPFLDGLADYNTSQRQYYATENTRGAEQGFPVGGWNGSPLSGWTFKGGFKARPDHLFIEAIRAYFDTNVGEYWWQPTRDPWSPEDYDNLRLQGASTATAMYGAGLSDAKVARRKAGEEAAFAVIDAGRFDITAGRPFDAAKRREMAHRAGLSDADTERLTRARLRPGSLNLAPLFAPAPKMKASAATILAAKSAGLTTPAPARAVRSLTTGPAPHPLAILGSGALCGVAGFFLAPREYRLPAAAGAAVAGLLLTRFVH